MTRVVMQPGRKYRPLKELFDVPFQLPMPKTQALAVAESIDEIIWLTDIDEMRAELIRLHQQIINAELERSAGR